MITLEQPKFGRPGDAILHTPPAVMAYSDLTGRDKRFVAQGRFGVGVHLLEEDMRQVARAMRDAFGEAYPGVTITPGLPIRRNRAGLWLLFASSTKKPACLDERRRPIDPPEVGATVTISARIAPYHRPDTNKAGVALYLNWLKLAAPVQAPVAEPCA